MARLAVLCSVVGLLVSSASLDAAAPASGQQNSQAVPWTPQPGARQFSTAGPKDPYLNLFGAPDRPRVPVSSPDPTPNGRSNQSPTSGEPRVVCGMTIIPVDPAVDPGVHVTPPDAGTEYTMRVLKLPICWPE